MGDCYGATDLVGTHKSCWRHGSETQAGSEALSVRGPSHPAALQGPTAGCPAASAGPQVFLTSEMSDMLNGGSAMAGGRFESLHPGAQTRCT